VGTTVGFLIFLTLLLLAVQMLVRLYATSALDRAAADAARSVAESADPAAVVAGAEVDGRAQLGTFGARHTTWTWKEVDGAQVVLQVRGVGPGLLPLPSSWRDISRTVTVRTERFR
jgi:hypothetical protein